MLVHVDPPFVELSHLDTAPVWPLSVIEPLAPVHTDTFPEVVPPTTCVTVIVVVAEFAEAQTPLCTTAR